MRSRFTIIVTHIVMCVGFILLPYSFDMRGAEIPTINLRSDLDRTVLFSYILILSFLYLNYYVLIPRFYFAKRYLVYWALVISICLVVVNVPAMFISLKGDGRRPPPELGPSLELSPMADQRDRSGPPEPPKGGAPPYTHGIFISAIGVFLTLYIRVNNQWKVNERKKLSAELSSLKFQINPHFLFNTLNSIYALSIRERASMTSDSIIKLSGIMRYVVSEAGKDYVPLVNEINYIHDYIALQKIRLVSSVNLDYTVKGDPGKLKISPLILISFIENAFKYGVNPDEKSELSIQIDIIDNELTLKVKNKKVKIGSTESTGSGIGIENTRSRLDFYYPGNYSLDINDDVEYFHVWLAIRLSHPD